MDVALLELHSHYRLADKPVRALEALRLFLPDQAEAVFASLRSGEPVVVRRGARPLIEQLASSMQAQGFRVQVRPGPRGLE